MRLRLMLAVTLLAFAVPLGRGHAAGLPARQAAIVRAVDADATAAIARLERIVNINSGTFNPAGVVSVGKILEHELQELGFTTHWIAMDAVHRAPSLFAELKGARGKRVLLLGHMDTVFELSSPFQKFERAGDTATGPGVADMKGGIIVMLSALKALKATNSLASRSVAVYLTGDEESAGHPYEISRGPMIEAARHSDAVLSYEGGIRKDGSDFATVARRGAMRWELRTKGNAGHSGGIFSEGTGDGAIFELSRILSRFHDELREPNMTFSPGLALGGANIQVSADGAASVSGKDNIVPGEAAAFGDLRALSIDQVQRIEAKMQAIVAASLPGTSATITFNDGYPPMAPTPGNLALLAELNAVNRLLGEPEMAALDPMQRGAGDASFVAPVVDVLDGLGAVGAGAHAPGETADLTRLPLQTRRTALLIDRLTHEPAPVKSGR